jgi:deoxyribonuclease-1
MPPLINLAQKMANRGANWLMVVSGIGLSLTLAGCRCGQPLSQPPPDAPSSRAVHEPAVVDPGSRNTTQTSFNRSKRALAAIYAEHRITFYCGCSFDANRDVDLASCAYVPKKDNRDARRIAWEHVVPAQALGHSLPAWREGHPDCVDRKGRRFRGRNCARKTSVEFRTMEADMYNLVPAIGEVNRLRSSFAMGEIPGEPRELGQCDFEVGDSVVEPREAIRGDIARTYLYMDRAYPSAGILDDKSRSMFDTWSRADPVDAWECERARRIAVVQGNVNEIVERACRSAGR